MFSIKKQYALFDTIRREPWFNIEDYYVVTIYPWQVNLQCERLTFNPSDYGFVEDDSPAIPSIRRGDVKIIIAPLK